MSASLVGSEMCIRDRPTERCGDRHVALHADHARQVPKGSAAGRAARPWPCLLYTSDAADDM
eukprot:7668587-Alexandrium_andersonii.AAC.1